MAYKPKTIKLTVPDAVSNAFSEFQTLGEEMRETADNMESGGLGHMPKCEQASEAADELEQHTEEPELPDWMANIEVEATEMVNKDKRKGPSRSVRLDNAKALLEAVTGHLGNIDDEELEKLRETLERQKAEAGTDDEVPSVDELREKCEEVEQELGEHTDFDVEFPGMFG